jgi:hypothetical protein
MSNRKGMPKQAFSGELKKGEKWKPKGSPVGHPVEGHTLYLFPNHCHEDVLVEAPSSRGAHHKIKPAAVLDYKYSVGRSDQMLSHY